MSTTFYSLGMFPYPSGAAHLGHVRVYTISDAAARHARLHGREVLHPMGWDAFGLPAENAAIAHGVDPAVWTARNIGRMREAFHRMGWSFDWDREITTSSPAYYRWTQWLFGQLFDAGLAVQADGWVHWCPTCATVLAAEQATDGVCWRCGSPVDRRRRTEWVFRITAYADRLWEGLSGLSGWDAEAVAVQRHWIGRSEGATVRFGEGDGAIEAFTTRPETLFGVVAVVVAPEHRLAQGAEDEAVRRYVQAAVKRSAVDRMREPERSGVPLGQTVTHPLTGEALPVWVADYVIGDYGTGAVMCVPAHDERDAAFAEMVGLPVRVVVEDERLVGSGSFDGLAVDEGARRITEALAAAGGGESTVTWNLRDWSVGRQRRWGCPIPVVHCDGCGVVRVPDEQLPVRIDDPIERACPGCGGPARREGDTLDTFVCSAWYAFRFTDPHHEAAAFTREVVDRWLPVDVYVGGLEHAAQHMLYFRFVTKVLHDLGHIGVEEPVERFVCNGMVLGADGAKMSKSRGNGVEPDTIVEQYGADALRLAILADVPVERAVPWVVSRVAGKERFLRKLGAMVDEVLASGVSCGDPAADPGPARRIYAAIDAIDADVAAVSLHTAVARVHELAAALQAVADAEPGALRAWIRDALVAMSVFVPGWVAGRWPEAWGRLEDARWPRSPGLAAPTWTCTVQVDGRTVARLEMAAGADEQAVRARAEEEPGVQRRIGAGVKRAIYVPDRLINLVTP